MTSPWHPLLQGEDEFRAREVITAIVRDVTPLDPPSLPFSWEFALFLGYYALSTGNQEDLRACERWVSASRQNLPEVGHLFGGLAGFAWVVHHLRSLGVLSGHQDLVNAVDRALLRDLTEPAESSDLISGTAGVALYALERDHTPLLQAAVLDLARSARPQSEGVYWPPSFGDEPEEVVKLGVSHGIPGVLPALAHAHLRDLTIARPLFDEALRGLLLHRLPGPLSFPSSFRPGQPPRPARLAWCYGDLGIATMLAALPATFAEARHLALDLALRCASRPEAEAGVETVLFCHGAIGVAHCFARLASSLTSCAGEPLPSLANAARAWYRRGLAWRTSAYPGGLALGSARERLTPQLLYGVVSGVAGVGLGLLAAVEPIDPGWDRMFALSTFPRSERASSG